MVIVLLKLKALKVLLVFRLNAINRAVIILNKRLNLSMV
jgi:hypothetical protein